VSGSGFGVGAERQRFGGYEGGVVPCKPCLDVTTASTKSTA
jgi:hypothetical protein